MNYEGQMFVPGAGMRTGAAYRRPASRPSDTPTTTAPTKAKPRTPIRIPNGEWKNKPVVADQVKRYPETIRFGPRKVKSFVLPTQEDELNTLFARAHPPTSPEIKIIEQPKREISNGTVIYLLEYCEIEYLQFAPVAAAPDAEKPAEETPAATPTTEPFPVSKN